MGAPRKNPPKNAAETILRLAKDGYTKDGIARNLGVSKNTFDKWLKEFPRLQDAMDEGRAKEHNQLYNALFVQATEHGHAAAAMFLLKCRHGYREGDQSDLANRVSIEFKLPGAMTPESFKVYENESDRIEQLPESSTDNTGRD